MHIAVLSDPGNFHTQKWAKALQRAGVQVTVFSFFAAQIEGVPCVHIPPTYTLQGKLTYGSYLYTTQALREALIAHQVDVVNPINITPFAVWATRAEVRPMVSIAMGADILEYAPKNQTQIPADRVWTSNSVGKQGPMRQLQHQVKSRMFRKQVKLALDAASLITADNLELIRAMKQWFGVPVGKMHLNRWGLEPELFDITEAEKNNLRKRFGVRDWQKVILSPRGLKPIYQGDVVMKAFELLVKRGMRGAKLILMSAGYDVPPEWDAKARQLHEQFDNFHYQADLLPREDMSALWRIVDAFISVPVYDGNSNALNEGRYAGAVPILNRIPANLEVVEPETEGIFLDSVTPELMADTILDLLPQLEAKKACMTSRNRSWVEANGLLEHNIADFIRDCERVLQKEGACWKHA
ncbi:MAG: glycosyltransferase [Bacteroidota bacterium]